MSDTRPIDPQLLRELAPRGELRAAINFGNIVLAQRGKDGGPPTGISVDIVHALGHALGIPVRLVTYDAAGKVFEALASEAWDVAFLAIEPARSEQIAFTPPYLHIEGAYLTRKDAPYQQPADVDQPNVRIAVGTGSAYDLFLTRTLQYATLQRYPNAPAAFAAFLGERLEVAAGVRQVVDAFAAGHQDLKVMADSFMTIRQAMGVPKAHTAAAAFLSDFIEDLKAQGHIATFMRRSGQTATVAPAGD